MKPSKIILGLFTAILALCAMIASAATPLIRSLTPSTGAVTFTNSAAYQVATIERVFISGIQPNDATVTVARISTVRNWMSTNTSVVTNGLLTIICTSAAGTSSNISRNLYSGDKLVFTGVGTNAGSIVIEATQQP